MSNTIKIKDLIKQAKLPERSVSICLDRSLVGDFEALERQFESMAAQVSTASLGGDPRTEVAQQIASLREQMIERSAEFRFRALPRRTYTALIRSHAPRDGDIADTMHGFNVDAVYEALVRGCCIEPALDEEDWTNLLGRDPNPNDPEDEGVPGVLSSRQYDILADLAWAVNRRDVDIPFSRAASQHLRTSERA